MNTLPVAYHITYLDGATGNNRGSLYSVPSVGDEIAIVHGFGTSTTLCRVTRIRHLAIRCDESQIPPTSQRIVIWADQVETDQAHKNSAMDAFM